MINENFKRKAGLCWSERIIFQCMNDITRNKYLAYGNFL